MGKEYCGTNNINHEYLGAGAIYFDWGLSTEVKMGITKGGNEFSDNAEFSSREADGDYAQVKGTRKITKFNPQLKVKALRISTANLLKYFAGLTADTTTLAGTTTLTRSLSLANSYITNVAFVGANRFGKVMVIVLENALADIPISIPATGRDEVITLDVTFTAHIDETFDPDTLSTYPYYITMDTSTVTFTVMNNANPAVAVEGASITVDLQVGLTNASGIKAFEIDKGTYSYTVSKSGHTTTTGSVAITASTTAVAVTLPVTP